MTILKTFIATCVLIVVLQIEVNHQTLESHLHRWLQTSQVTQNVHEVARGAVFAIRDIYKKAEDSLRSHLNPVTKKENQGSNRASH